MTVIDKLRAHYEELSASHKTLARFVVSYTAHSAFLPITRLAEMTNVSPATVVRFAQSLGYEGYPEFQAAIQAIVLDQVDVSNRFEYLEEHVEGVLSGEIDLDNFEFMRTVMIAQAEQVIKAADVISRDEFEQTVDHIFTARKVYIVGLRLSSTVATALWHGLHTLRSDVHLVQPGAGFFPDQFSELNQDDLVIGITFRRYMQNTIDCMKFAKDKKAFVVALTDHRLSPAALLANTVLVTPVTLQLSHMPLAPAFGLISAIIECVSLTYRKRGEIDRVRYLDELTQNFNVFEMSSDVTETGLL